MYSKSKRFIASFLAVLMAVCLLPMDVANVAYAEELSAPQIETPADTDEPAGIVEETEEDVDSDTNIDDEESNEEVDIDTADKGNAEEAASEDSEADEAVTVTEDEEASDIVASEEEYTDAATAENSVARMSVNKEYILDFESAENSTTSLTVTNADGDTKDFTLTAGAAKTNAGVKPAKVDNPSASYTKGWKLDSNGAVSFSAATGSTVEMLVWAVGTSSTSSISVAGVTILDWSNTSEVNKDGTKITEAVAEQVTTNGDGTSADRLYKITVTLGTLGAGTDKWEIKRGGNKEMTLFYVKVSEPTEVTAENLTDAEVDFQLTANQDGWSKDNDTWTKTYTGDEIKPKVTVTKGNTEVASTKYTLSYARGESDTTPEAGAYQDAEGFDFKSAGTIYVKVTSKYDDDNTKSPSDPVKYTISKNTLTTVSDPEPISVTFDEANAQKEFDLSDLFKDIKGTKAYELDATGSDNGEVVSAASIDEGTSVVKYTVASVDKTEKPTPKAAILKVKVTLQNYEDITITITIEMGDKEEITFELGDVPHTYGTDCDFAKNVEIKNIKKKDGTTFDDDTTVAQNIKANLTFTFTNKVTTPETPESVQDDEVPHVHAGEYTVTAHLGDGSRYTAADVTADHEIVAKPIYIKAIVDDWDKSLKFAPVSKTATDTQYEFVAAPASENESAVTADEDNVNLGLEEGDSITTQPTIVYYAKGTTTPMSTTAWSTLAKGATVDVALIGAETNNKDDYDIESVTATLNVKQTELSAIAALSKDVNSVTSSDSTLSSLNNTSDSTAAVTTTDGFVVAAGFKVDSSNSFGSYSKRLKTGGAGNPVSKSIAFTIDNPAKLTVNAASSSSDPGNERKMVLATLDTNKTLTECVNTMYSENDGSKKAYTEANKLPIGLSLTKIEVDLDTPGTYYLYSSASGINFGEVKVEYTESSDETVDVTSTTTGDSLPDGTNLYFVANDTAKTATPVSSTGTTKVAKNQTYTVEARKTDGSVDNTVTITLTVNNAEAASFDVAEAAVSVAIKVTVEEEGALARPTATPASGTLHVGDKVELSAATGTTIRYTINGDVPTADTGLLYDKDEKISITEDHIGTLTIKAIAVMAGTVSGNDASATVSGNSSSVIVSKVATFTYTVTSGQGVEPTKPAAPTATPASGRKIKVGSTVRLTAISGAEIYYNKGTSSDIAAPTKTTGTKYTNPIEMTAADKGTVVIKAIAVKDNLESDPETFTYTVSDEVNTGFYVELVDDGTYTYTGSAIKPVIEVYNNDELLTEGVDYTVKYTNNVNASTKKPATLTVTGKGRFSGSQKVEFNIAQKSLGNAENGTVGDGIKTGNIVIAKGSKAAPVIIYNGIKLANKDIVIPNTKYNTVTTDETPEAEKTVIITAKENGNFTGSLKLDVKVVEKKELKNYQLKVALTKGVTYTYNGSPQEVSLDVKNASGSPVVEEGHLSSEYYYVSYNTEDLTNAGVVKFTVYGTGDYAGSVSKSFTIKPADKRKTTVSITGTPWSGSYEVPYTSAGATLDSYFDDEIEVKAAIEGVTESLTLKKDRDYKVTYSANKKSGTAKATVSFIGNYKGIAKQQQTFTIKGREVNAAVGSADLEAINLDVKFGATKPYKKEGIYKAPVIISMDGVTVKNSEFDIKYYTEAAGENGFDPAKEMKGKNKLIISSEGEITADSATVYVELTGKAKGNFAGSKITGKYQVYKEATYDLSKAKVTFYNYDAKKAKYVAGSKLPYTGEAIVFGSAADDTNHTPYLEVKIGKDTVPTAAYKVEYVNNTLKGKATVIIVPNTDGAERTAAGSKTVNFTITALNLKNYKDVLAGLFHTDED